jgi:hypothetical protein
MTTKRRRFITITLAGLLALPATMLCASDSGLDGQILRTREAVWRAWFANDKAVLEKLVPEDAIVIGTGNPQWRTQADVFRSAAHFQSSGGKLIRLEFPLTRMQHFGDVAVIYTTYVVETEEDGKRSVESGRATEIFVLRNGKWVNAGWHTDAEK